MYVTSRCFLIAFVVLLGGACQSRQNTSTSPFAVASPQITVSGSREYDVHEQLELINEGPGQPGKQNLWVALIRDFPPYQDVLSMDVSSANYKPISDEYGNQYAEFDFSDHPPATTIRVQIDYRIKVNELEYDLSSCKGDVPDDSVQPELHIESANPQIVNLARELSGGKTTICQQVRSFYDYEGDNLVYTYNGKNWGAQATLGTMGADCTEYTSLMVALSRSQRIPARYFEGLLFVDSQTQDKAQLEHSWPDVFLPGAGWTAMDPTLGRAHGDRNTYFAHYTPEHIIVTVGANPSTLRGGSYWTHLYWPGNSTTIRVQAGWEIKLVE
jgi:transglutaminase-like putative cysteine protease